MQQVLQALHGVSQPRSYNNARGRCLQGVSPSNPSVPCNYFGYVRVVADLNTMTLTVCPASHAATPHAEL